MAVKRAKTSRRRSVSASSTQAKTPARIRTASTRTANGKTANGKTANGKTANGKTAGIETDRGAGGRKLAGVRKLAAPKAKPAPAGILPVVEGALDEMKAVNVRVLDVANLTDIADTMIIASGNSDRHVRSIADRIVEHAKKAGFRPMGVEGERDGEWVLVDLQDVIVHIMLPRVREFYRLESLWDVSAARREAMGSA